jgi:hypothetical protein
MVPQKRKDRLLVGVRITGLLIAGLSFLGLLSCNWGTGSTTSSGSSGTGVGWKITITPFANSVSSSQQNSTQVMIIVKDSSGAPAPKGTPVCYAALRGGFLLTGNTVIASKCDTTSNDIGQVLVTYIPSVLSEVTTVDPTTGTSTTVTKQVPIDPGPDTISASSMGAFGSTTINVTP